MGNLNNWLKPELVWFVLGFIFLILEFAVPGLIIVFFGVGAWIVAIICMIWSPSLNVQLIIFIITSLLSIGLLRKWLQTKFFDHSNGQDESKSIDDFIGHTVKVLSDIEPGGEGKVEFRGTSWRALSEKEFKVGESAVIMSKENLTLKIK